MYEDERRIAVCMVFWIFGEKEGKELFRELTGTPLEEQAELSIALLEAVDISAFYVPCCEWRGTNGNG